MALGRCACRRHHGDRVQGDCANGQVILLDRVQKRLRIPADAHRMLKSAGLVEGRYPNLIIAARVAEITGQKARHIRERGFDKQYYLDAIEALVRAHQPIPRSEIDRLLVDKLPEILSEVQKRTNSVSTRDAERLRRIVAGHRRSETGRFGVLKLPKVPGLTTARTLLSKRPWPTPWTLARLCGG